MLRRLLFSLLTYSAGAIALLTPWAEARAQEDVADVRAKRFTLENRRLQYILIASAGELATPDDGYKLLLAMPGGDGSADFTPFVKRIYKHALDKEYLVAQLLAPQWNRQETIVWPTKQSRARGNIDIETFVAQVVADVAGRTKVDKNHVFTLSWSSGGPAAYAASLADGTPVTGSLVTMSVFKPDELPALSRAKGKAYYILHSPDDRVCPFRMAKAARDELTQQGAKVQFATYPGGHGWRGDIFGNIRAGVTWLEEQTQQVGEQGSNDDE